MIFDRHKTIASCNEQWTVTRKVYETLDTGAYTYQVINMTKMLEIEMLINARRRLWIKELENIMSYLFYCCILYIYEGKI